MTRAWDSKRSADMGLSAAGLFRICQLFFEDRLSAQRIAERLGQEGLAQLNRQTILPKLVEAYGKGMVRLIPPRHGDLERQLATRFGLDDGQLRVVNVDDERATKVDDRWAEVHVAAAAADLVLELMKRPRIVAESQEIGEQTVTLGLGPGRATLEFSHFLSQRLRADPIAPDLKLVAITGGSVPDCPQYAPLSFFNLFPAELVKESIGLFAEMLVSQGRFDTIKTTRVGIREAFEVRHEVEIVVTAMGDFQDDHDQLRRALLSAGATIGGDWVGNVQYRPYSATKPILQRGDQWRAVTLFELADFVDMARDPGKCVVLIARRCGVCGKTKAAAVRPLLEQRALRVFSHLVMDLATARELLEDPVRRKRRPANPGDARDKPPSDENQRKAVTFWLCDAFFNRHKTVKDIAHEADAAHLGLIREAIYPRLAAAAGEDLKLLEVVTPLETKLVEELAAKFGLPPEQVRVVDAAHPAGGREAAAAAAELVMTLAKKLAGSSGRRVGLGLGPGRATLDFSTHLGRLLREERKYRDDPAGPQLDLIAISAGCVPKFPKFAAESFFNLFPKQKGSNSIGLFAETLVTNSEYRQIVEERRPGVREALDWRDRGAIDIVVTAIGDFEDDHDLLGMLLRSAEIEPPPSWVGSVQHRPYGATEPVCEGDDDLRAVTLFELADLVALAGKKDKHVVLIARQCGQCGRTRASALRPLLTEPRLRVWSELVMDVATARELIRRP